MHPRRVGPYVIERDLGRGAQGAVFQALDTRTNERVALKVLASPSERVRRRFLREGRALASLRHPNILAVREVVDGLAPLLVTDLIEGESLQARLDREGPLPLREALAITSKLALALDYAHQVGVLHRDVKPDNVLLTRGEPVLVDFGLAKLTDPAGAQSRLTEEGQFLGTPGFWSPEQASGAHDPDPRSDVYALGATLHALLTGAPPFVADTIFDALALVASAAPEPPSRRRPDVPPALDAVCLRCLEKDPAARYPTARALAHDLEALLHAPEAPPAPRASGRAAAARPRSQRTRRASAEAPPRRGGRGLAVGGALAIALVAGALLVVSRRDAAPPPPAPTEPPPPTTEAPPSADRGGDAAILAVRVVDERGAPVDGAAVVALPASGDLPPRWRERRTDADGRVLLPVDADGGPVIVDAWTARRLGRAGPLAVTRDRPGEARVVLDQPAGTGTLRLHVLVGDPPAPARAVLSYRHGQGTFGMRRFEGDVWIVDRVDAPLVAVAVWGEEAGAGCVVARVTPGDTTEATLVLPAGATLRGRLIGVPPSGVSDARVRVATALGPWGLVGVADADVRPDGAFEVRGLRPGAAHRVVVNLPGYLPIEVRDDVVASPAATLDVRLPEVEALVVEVEDERGLPVEGAEVEVSANGDAAAWWPATRRARTDRRGRAVWLGTPMVPDAVLVTAPGHEPASVTDALGSFVRVRLEAAAAWSGLAGVTVDEHGRALPGVVVRARSADGQPLPSIVSDETGGFRVPCPEGATVELTFEAPERVRRVRRVLAGGAEPSGLRVVLPPGVRVSGAVRGALGARVESVRAAGPEGEVERAVVSSDGAFDLGRLTPGRWVFTASVRREDGRTGFRHADVLLSGAEQEVVLVVDEADDEPR